MGVYLAVAAIVVRRDATDQTERNRWLKKFNVEAKLQIYRSTSFRASSVTTHLLGSCNNLADVLVIQTDKRRIDSGSVRAKFWWSAITSIKNSWQSSSLGRLGCQNLSIVIVGVAIGRHVRSVINWQSTRRNLLQSLLRPVRTECVEPMERSGTQSKKNA